MHFFEFANSASRADGLALVAEIKQDTMQGVHPTIETSIDMYI